MILVFNIGSASLRWCLYNKQLEEVEGEDQEYPNFQKLEKQIQKIIQHLISNNYTLSKIGHRVVHGGVYFNQPTKIDNNSIEKLKELNSLAPLHNPQALKVIKVCQDKLPQTPQLAVFDTSFFTQMPDYARYYSLPMELAEKHKIYRYGFHGISHEYVAQQGARKIGQKLENLKLITVHLGAGASITAIEDGKPIDTSMGFTPTSGLIMATRSGNIDPIIPLFLEETGIPRREVKAILNKQSGLKGVSGFTNDMRDILKVSQSKEKEEEPERKKRAGLALQMYAYKIKKYIGAYAVALSGVDALILTGAVAEGSQLVCNMITHGLKEVLGTFETLVIPTNEELAIAKKIKDAATQNSKHE
ncbi:MAG: acetate/propionate family kinase [Patescibacteria group bacterium]|nr:acetate/propionate family kinase [Patescibacteria group bacterium]